MTPSETASLKTSVDDMDGAVKAGFTAAASDSVTVGPCIWVHWYEDIPAEAEEREPSRVTDALTATSRSGPAFAVTWSIRSSWMPSSALAVTSAYILPAAV